MLGLASFIMRGHLQAALVAATALMLTLIFPPAAWLSGAAIGLVFLRKSARDALFMLVLAAAGATLLAALAIRVPQTGLLLAMLLWIPVVSVSIALRRTAVLAYSLQIAGAIGLLVVLTTFVLLDDPAQTWERALRQVLLPESGGPDLGISGDRLEALLVEAGRLMTGSMASMIIVNTMLSLLLARYWQAALFNPGGFQAEFHQLRLGRAVAGIGALIGVSALLAPSDILASFAMVALVVFLFQGVAIAHAFVKSRALGRAWLIGLYVLLFVVPQTAVALAVMGIADAWVDIRSRLGGSA